jgi:hypothetical protein
MLDSSDISQVQNLVEQQGCQADFDSWHRIKAALAESINSSHNRQRDAMAGGG